MKKELYQTPYISTMRSQSSDRVEHRKVWGVLFMLKLKHIPTDICERCLDVLAAEIGRLEVRQQINPMPKEAYKMKRLSLDLKVIYYKHILQRHGRLG